MAVSIVAEIFFSRNFRPLPVSLHFIHKFVFFYGPLALVATPVEFCMRANEGLLLQFFATNIVECASAANVGQWIFFELPRIFRCTRTTCWSLRWVRIHPDGFSLPTEPVFPIFSLPTDKLSRRWELYSFHILYAVSLLQPPNFLDFDKMFSQNKIHINKN